jgi:hypothetical protein
MEKAAELKLQVDESGGARPDMTPQAPDVELPTAK